MINLGAITVFLGLLDWQVEGPLLRPFQAHFLEHFLVLAPAFVGLDV